MRRSRIIGAVVLALSHTLLLGMASTAHGQGAGTPQGNDPLAEHLIPPDLVMRHQVEIGLTAAQREGLIKELQRAQAEMVPAQFEMEGASQALAALVSGRRVDEERALAQARKLMDLEAQVKAKHLTLLIRVKNLLSPEQQERLRSLRSGGAR